ncbi:uncharacterized protein [Onthophagus taurus]|uniref:uncharacterized protein n=1 Tax=Onthophagus taurus TaxID=166361 RepID=UPI000C20BB44|nr:uncharacterized protein LOC111422697 [Onthophagus taurus]
MKTFIFFTCAFILVQISKQQDFGDAFQPVNNISLCCNKIYDQKHFTIISPGFPNGQLTDVDCEYRIKRANDNICRLKLKFNFFSSGIFKNGDCLNGYMEIDGKKICGCATGVKLTVNFDQNLRDEIKVIKYRENDGFLNGVSGFSIEITQDSCPEKLQNKNTYNKELNLRSYYTYYYNYFDDYEQESSYIDVSQFDNKNNNCNKWHQINHLHHVFKSWYHNSPRCPQKIDYTSRCIILNSINGSFRSAGYPYWYGNNLNQCYRFIQQPGFCSVKVHMLDFQLQNSYDCYNDYLLFNNKHRSCGNELCNKVFYLPFKQQHYDLFFITDYCFCNRGFAGTYEQISCNNETTTEVITTESNTEIITTTELELIPCGGLITAKNFTLDIFEYQQNMCRFVVRRFSDAICTLGITFNDFNLDCNVRNLIINGTTHCGYKSGEEILLSFTSNNDEIEILYQGNNVGGRNRILSLDVIQKDFDCSPDLEVPPPS